MRAVWIAALLASICAHGAVAHTCATVPSHPRENDKKYAAKRVAGDKAFREAKYQRALSEYLGSLSFQDEAGAAEAYFRLGETHAMLGDSEKAYSCILESGPSKVPANRILATGFTEPKARDAAQILLDTIQQNTPRYPFGTFPEYLALAAIFRQNGLIAQAQAAETEGRINREAADAWEAALAQSGPQATLAAADRAAMEVYEREDRPEAAEILRAQAAGEPPRLRRKHSFWRLLVTANL